ncbi:MAG: ribosome biogenesis GTPase Der [Pseudomonadota bacterium]
MSFTLAIVGRPNVGKSTLFNRLVGKRLALVDDRPGVTRDLREGDARLVDLRFTVIDTAGVEEADAASLTGRMRALTERAIAQADAALFMVDARTGVTAADQTLAEMLRKSGKPVILAANKAEGRGGDGAYDAYRLGLGDPVALSAEHGEGLPELYGHLEPLIGQVAPAERGADAPIQIAVVGRPNAGKSTLINRILGMDRLLTGPEAGITRDAISVNVDWGGQAFRIFDTAGMRKKARVQEKLEKLSVADGLRAVRFAEVVVLVIDPAQPFDQQDLRIADLAEREGRAVVVAASKWDQVHDRKAVAAGLEEAFGRLLPQLSGAPLVQVSGLTGAGLGGLRRAILAAHEVWNARVSTGALNRWLAGEIAAHPPPAPGGRRIKLRYMTQVKTRPPSFALFCSNPQALPAAYRRFLVNGLRRDFDLKGTPIRLMLRGGDNPYSGKKKRRATALDKHLGKRKPA